MENLVKAVIEGDGSTVSSLVVQGLDEGLVGKLFIIILEAK